jgi:hypothetical protein
MNIRYFSVFLLLLLVSCGKDKHHDQTRPAESAEDVHVPAFNADSAYQFVKIQVDFGPRIPNTPEHERAAGYFVRKLKEYNATVAVQEFTAQNYSGIPLRLKNIIASFNPERTKRILLAAHWDTRPFSDKDPAQPTATFPGANDGASGVGVLLEIARVLSKSPLPDVGVDLILFDGEDWGEKEGEQGTHPLPEGLKDWWCLGSQYWSSHKHKPNYSAYYGILLDMVGASTARFPREGYSMEFAPTIVDNVWDHAQRLGYSHVFIRKTEGPVTDDHYFVNTVAKIPMIDIIHYEPGIGYFGDFHHNQKDNLSIISKDMLGMVGTTLLNVLYFEK